MSDAKQYSYVSSIQKEMICIYDKRCVIKWVNEAYAKFFGKSQADFVGVNFLDFIPKEDRKKTKDIIKSISAEMPKITTTHRVISPNGSTGWQEWTDEAVFSENGKIIEYRSVGMDVTELVELRQKLIAHEAANISSDTQDAVMMVKSDSTKHIIKMSDIAYVRADLMKSDVITVNGVFKIGKQIKTVEREVEKYGFVRIHKSYIVNLNYIAKLVSINDSKYRVVFLHTDDEIETSKAGAKKLRDLALKIKRHIE